MLFLSTVQLVLNRMTMMHYAWFDLWLTHMCVWVVTVLESLTEKLIRSRI